MADYRDDSVFNLLFTNLPYLPETKNGTILDRYN